MILGRVGVSTRPRFVPTRSPSPVPVRNYDMSSNPCARRVVKGCTLRTTLLQRTSTQSAPCNDPSHSSARRAAKGSMLPTTPGSSKSDTSDPMPTTPGSSTSGCSKPCCETPTSVIEADIGAHDESATIVIVGGGPHALAALAALHEGSLAFQQYGDDSQVASFKARVGFESLQKIGTGSRCMLATARRAHQASHHHMPSS